MLVHGHDNNLNLKQFSKTNNKQTKTLQGVAEFAFRASQPQRDSLKSPNFVCLFEIGFHRVQMDPEPIDSLGSTSPWLGRAGLSYTHSSQALEIISTSNKGKDTQTEKNILTRQFVFAKGVCQGLDQSSRTRGLPGSFTPDVGGDVTHRIGGNSNS